MQERSSTPRLPASVGVVCTVLYYFIGSRDCLCCTVARCVTVAIIVYLWISGLVNVHKPALRLLRGLLNFHQISGRKFRYPEGSVGHQLAQGGSRRSGSNRRCHLANLMVLLRAELTIPALVTSSATVSACNLYTWPGRNYSKDNGECYSCLLCKCNVCNPAHQWLTHISGQDGRLLSWHEHSITNTGRLAASRVKIASVLDWLLCKVSDLILHGMAQTWRQYSRNLHTWLSFRQNWPRCVEGHKGSMLPTYFSAPTRRYVQKATIICLIGGDIDGRTLRSAKSAATSEHLPRATEVLA